ncbi:MAG: ABC transporter ATP-binding protein [Acidobacteria bacterium]|nr:ABC transporter ATP-binding protein [Acidobacteriota bacterium]
MKSPPPIRETLRGVMKLLGRPGLLLLTLEILSSVLLALLEYVLAWFFVLFMSALGITAPGRLPGWLPFSDATITSPWIWLGLLGVAILQALARVGSFQSKILLTGRVNVRLKMALTHLLLWRKANHPLPASTIDFYYAECFDKAGQFTFHFVQTLSFLIQVVLIAAGMTLLAWGPSLVGLVFMGLLGLMVLGFNRSAQRASLKMTEAVARMYQAKTRVVRNWFLIHVLRIQEQESRLMLEPVFAGYRHNAVAFLMANLSLVVMPVLGVLVLAAIVASNLCVFHVATGSFAAFLFMYMRLQQKMSNGANLVGELFASREYFRRALALVDSLSPAELRQAFRPESGFHFWRAHLQWRPFQPPPAAAPEPDAAPPALEADHLAFRWPDAAEPVFHDLSFTIPAGAHCGIVGSNGSGKSTLLGCLLGIYAPSAGSSRIDGRPAAAFLEERSQTLAYVGPEPFLIEGSLRENLEYGRTRTGAEEDLWRALAAVQLDGFVRGLPQGLETRIGESGDGLSSGERQRLTIARALLRRPRLLVMDEPSANVDEWSEKALVEALRSLKGRCTVVVVSHRPGILAAVDRTLDMDRGLLRDTPFPPSREENGEVRA